MPRLLLAAGALYPHLALAQTPARFYWKTLSDANAVPVIVRLELEFTLR